MEGLLSTGPIPSSFLCGRVDLPSHGANRVAACKGWAIFRSHLNVGDSLTQKNKN